MGEFDLTLINEFRSCPSFYDRSNPRFKDKTFNAHHWQEISNKLGFDVSILKDRILQLRNRYNLEKRRLEQLREENPGKNFDSPWPLYDHLYFLSQHIRSRRSYRKLLPLNTHHDKGGDDDDDDDEDYVGGGGTASRKDHSRQNTFQNEYYNAVAARTEAAPAATASEDSQREQQSMVQFPNGLLTVKMEDDSEESAANETDSHINEPHAYIVNRSIPHSMPQKLKLKKQNPSSPPHIPTITIRRFETMRSQEKQNRQNAAIAAAAAAAVAPPPPSRISKRRFATENAAQQQQQQQPPAKVRTPCSTPQPHPQQHTPLGPPQTAQQQYQQQQQQQQLAPAATAHLAPPPAPPAHLPDTNQTHDIFTKYARLSPRELKYAAFGQFISSSLLDLPMGTALELVEKFTSEIVRTLKEKQQDNSASSFNGFDENEQ